jgi:hypothetical protein
MVSSLDESGLPSSDFDTEKFAPDGRLHLGYLNISSPLNSSSLIVALLIMVLPFSVSVC